MCVCDYVCVCVCVYVCVCVCVWKNRKLSSRYTDAGVISRNKNLEHESIAPVRRVFHLAPRLKGLSKSFGPFSPDCIQKWP